MKFCFRFCNKADAFCPLFRLDSKWILFTLLKTLSKLFRKNRTKPTDKLRHQSTRRNSLVLGMPTSTIAGSSIAQACQRQPRNEQPWYPLWKDSKPWTGTLRENVTAMPPQPSSPSPFCAEPATHCKQQPTRIGIRCWRKRLSLCSPTPLPCSKSFWYSSSPRYHATRRQPSSPV